MPKVAIAESLSDWEGLLTSASAIPFDDALLSEQLAEFRTLLEQAKGLHARRMHLEGERRAAAQALEEITGRAKTMASRIRSKLKGSTARPAASSSASESSRARPPVETRRRSRPPPFSKKSSPAPSSFFPGEKISKGKVVPVRSSRKISRGSFPL